MFKTLSVSIGKMPFIIEEQAYATLDQYLKAIRAHFASSADADEIVSDIESRIAEEFSDALGKSRKIIETQDIDAVIATMGTIEDFKQFEGGEKKAEQEDANPFRKLRLYRDADNQILGGVCAGIANYFNIDPIFIRLAFGLSIFLGGFGVVLYIILWICIPEARTTAQKVEMTGGRLTISAIQKKIDDVVPPAKRKSMIAKILAFPFQIIGTVLRAAARVIKFLLPVVARIAGAFVTIVCAFVIASLTFTLFALLLNPNSPYIGLPLHEAMSTTSYIALLLCGYFVMFLPVLLVLLAGASLLVMRNLFSVTAVVALTILWFGTGTMGAVMIFNAAPQLEPMFAQFDEQMEKSFELEDFTKISADDIDRMVITQGEEFSVIVEGSERALGIHQPIVENGTLSLESTDDNDPCIFFCLSQRAMLRVTMPSVESVDALDASRVYLEGFSGGTIAITALDIGHVEAELTMDSVMVDVKDNGSVELTGSAEKVTATAQDIGNIWGEDFVVQDATVTLKDMGRAILDVRRSLNGSASDMSRMEYMSAPATMEFELQDMGSQERRDWE
jgi:phage shock protein PspC (stress-responsive transcriptional regulator)